MKTITIRNGLLAAALLLAATIQAVAGGTGGERMRTNGVEAAGDSLLDRLEKVVSAKINARKIENARRIRSGLKPDYIIRVGDGDLASPGTDFPANVYPLTQLNTRESDVEKLWDFSGNAYLQPIPQQLQQWSAAQGYDYYIVVCAIYNYFRLDEETKFNNITWDSIGTLAARSGAGRAGGTKTNVGNYSKLFNYLVSKFKADPSIPKPTAGHPAIYHFVISTYVPFKGASDNAPYGKLRHFQGVFWDSPNGDTTYDNIFQAFVKSTQAEVTGIRSSNPGSKEAWLAAFISSNQKMIAGIRDLNTNDLMACTNADSMNTMLAATPVQVLGGFSAELRIHCLEVLAGPEIPASREPLVLALLEQAPAAQADAIIGALRNADPYTPAMVTDYTNQVTGAAVGTLLPQVANPKVGACLLQCLTEQLNDYILPIWGGQNYHQLILDLTSLCFHSTGFLQAVQQLNAQVSDSSLDQLPRRYIGYSYNSFWSQVQGSFFNHSYVTIPSIDWKVSFIKNCQLSINKELSLSLLIPNAPLDTLVLDPFAPIIFQNNSDLGMLTDLAPPGKTLIVPAILMKYASQKGDNQTLTDEIMAKIDVASLATGYGELQAGITGIRKAYVLFDMFNAGINLTVNVINYQNNPTLSKVLTCYNLVTGGISAGRIASGAVKGIYNGIRTQAGNVLAEYQLRQYLAAVKAAGPELANLQGADYATVKALVQRTGLEAGERGLATIQQESQDALTAINSAAQTLAGDLSWIDALQGLTNDVKTALKADIQSSPPLASLFSSATTTVKQQLAEAYSLLYGSVGNTSAANALFRNPDALKALAKIRTNGALTTYGITDAMLAQMRGWGNSTVVMSYDQVIDNLDNFLTFLTNQDVTCDNCTYLFNRFLQNSANTTQGEVNLGNNKQAVYWIMEHIASDAQTFGNKSIKIEYALPGGGGRIDVIVEGAQVGWHEFKWLGSSTISKEDFIQWFVKRDLANFPGALENLNWHLKGNQLTIDEVRAFLADANAQAALNNNQIFSLFNNYAIEIGYQKRIFTLNTLNDFLTNNSDWFTAIFK